MKHIKMIIYGEPGVGKSTFAFHFPKPFFITTDPNYEYLEDYGAKEEDHKHCKNWGDFVEAVKMDFSNYQTVVVDLLEDVYAFSEKYITNKNKVDYIGDIDFGKGWSMLNKSTEEVVKNLINNENLNVVLICHESSKQKKTKLGKVYDYYYPSSKLRENFLDSIEGTVRMCVRAYKTTEITEDERVITKRWLSLIPDTTEYGIFRGIDENSVPHNIPLDFDIFAKTINLKVDNVKVEKPKTPNVVNPIKEEVQPIQEELVKQEAQPIQEEKEVKRVRRLRKLKETQKTEEPIQKVEEPIKEVVEEPKDDLPTIEVVNVEEGNKSEVPVSEEVKVEQPITEAQPKVENANDKKQRILDLINQKKLQKMKLGENK